MNSIPIDRKKPLLKSHIPIDYEFWNILKSALDSLPADSGFIISGYPRTITQLILLELNRVSYDLIVLLNQPEELIIKKASKRKQCESCNRSFNNEEFEFEDYYLKKISPQVDLTCPFCEGQLIERKEDNFKSVKRRFFEYTVFLSHINSLPKYTEKILHFELFRGVEDFDRLVGGIDSQCEKLMEKPRV